MFEEASATSDRELTEEELQAGFNAMARELRRRTLGLAALRARRT